MTDTNELRRRYYARKAGLDVRIERIVHGYQSRRRIFEETLMLIETARVLLIRGEPRAKVASIIAQLMRSDPRDAGITESIQALSESTVEIAEMQIDGSWHRWSD